MFRMQITSVLNPRVKGEGENVKFFLLYKLDVSGQTLDTTAQMILVIDSNSLKVQAFKVGATKT